MFDNNLCNNFMIYNTHTRRVKKILHKKLIITIINKKKLFVYFYDIIL